MQQQEGTSEAMRGGITTEASLTTRLSVWWASVPCVTGAVFATCVLLHLVVILGGFDVLPSICFSPRSLLNGQVYTPFTAVVFHGGLLHLVFNMMAYVPMGGSLERQLGSVRYAYLLLVFAVSNALIATLISSLAAMPFLPLYPRLMEECSIGLSGILFGLIVVETYTSGVQTRSIFGFFTVQAKWYPWVLLLLFQFLLPSVSLVGHLSGILSGLAYSYGLLTSLMLPSAACNAIESSSLLAALVRRPNFIVGGSFVSGSLPTFGDFGRMGRSAAESAEGAWRNTQRYFGSQESPRPHTVSSPTPSSTEDPRFPGQGRVLGGPANQSGAGAAGPYLPIRNAGSEKHQTLQSHSSASGGGSPAVPVSTPGQTGQTDSKALSQLVAMGFDQASARTALSAANGDLSLAIELLSSST